MVTRSKGVAVDIDTGGSMKWAVILICLSVAAGCASQEAIGGLREAEKKVHDLEKRSIVIAVDLLDPSGLSKEEVERRETEIFRSLSETCLSAYGQRLGEGLHKAAYDIGERADFTKFDRLPSFAHALDKFLDDCGKEYGASVRVFIEMDERREVQMPMYLREIGESGRDLLRARAAVQREESDSRRDWLLFAAGFTSSLNGAPNAFINPDQIYVGPYLRGDGRIVPGHFRTLPNATCLDNINGC